MRRGAIKISLPNLNPNRLCSTGLKGKGKEKKGATLPGGRDIGVPGVCGGCSPFPSGLLLHFPFLLNEALEPSSRPPSRLQESRREFSPPRASFNIPICLSNARPHQQRRLFPMCSCFSRKDYFYPFLPMPPSPPI